MCSSWRSVAGEALVAPRVGVTEPPLDAAGDQESVAGLEEEGREFAVVKLTVRVGDRGVDLPACSLASQKAR